jgi:hypothetical protein
VVAVVDPPRAGLHKDVLLALLACPAIKRLVFVSCNPDSLVLNSKLLCGRYRPDINAPKGECGAWDVHARMHALCGGLGFDLGQMMGVLIGSSIGPVHSLLGEA